MARSRRDREKDLTVEVWRRKPTTATLLRIDMKVVSTKVWPKAKETYSPVWGVELRRWADGYVVWHAHSESWVGLKEGDWVRIDRRPDDVYPVHDKVLRGGYEPADPSEDPRRRDVSTSMRGTGSKDPEGDSRASEEGHDESG